MAYTSSVCIDYHSSYITSHHIRIYIWIDSRILDIIRKIAEPLRMALFYFIQVSFMPGITYHLFVIFFGTWEHSLFYFCKNWNIFEWEICNSLWRIKNSLMRHGIRIDYIYIEAYYSVFVWYMSMRLYLGTTFRHQDCPAGRRCGR